MIIKTYHNEAVILERRLELLRLVDDYARQHILHPMFAPDQFNELFFQFRDVSEPKNYVSSLKKIYGDDLADKDETVERKKWNRTQVKREKEKKVVLEEVR